MKSKQIILFSALFLFAINACKQDSPPGETPEIEDLGEIANDYESNPYQWGFIDRTGRLQVMDQFDEVRAFSQGLALVRQDGKWGFIDKEGQLKIACKYRAAWSFEKGMARIQNEEGLFGFIYTTGDVAIKPQWKEATNFRSDLSCVRIGNKYGFINRQGKVVIKAGFDRSTHFEEHYAVIKQGHFYGMINQKGEQIIAPKYDRLKPFKNNKARALQDGKYGFINPKGKWMINPQFIQAADFNNGFAPAFDGKQWGLINEKGKWAIIPKYNQLFWAADHRWIAETNEVYRLIDEKDKVLSDDFDEIHPFSQNRAPFRKGDLWGYINTDAEIVSPPSFYLAWPFNNDYARVATDNGLTYIDTTGFFIMPPNPIYLEIRDFSETLAPVQIYKN